MDDPPGQRRMEACFYPDLEALPGVIPAEVVMRWSSDVTDEEARAHRGLETSCPSSDQAMAHPTPVLWMLFSLVTVPALPLPQRGQVSGRMIAWYHEDVPTFSDCLALVCRQFGRARDAVSDVIPGAACRS
jgi:hypothetical protein